MAVDDRPMADEPTGGTDSPPLTIVLPVRRGHGIAETVLDALVPQAARVGAEIVVVGDPDFALAPAVRLVSSDDQNLFLLRKLGVEHAHGAVVTIAEDHAVPRDDWCASTLRAHAEHADVPAVAGRLANATDATVVGRSNFLAFAAQSLEPDTRRAASPPPLSALSFKASALVGPDRVGWMETEMLPRMFEEGGIAVAPEIVVDHHQDHGLAWSVVNAFHAARAGYGYASSRLPAPARRRQAVWALTHLPQRGIVEACAARAGRRTVTDLAVVAVLVVAMAIGGAVGSVFGPGSSPDHVA